MARRRQSVTIKHVAADAGVSLQTVSRVINNEPNVRPAMVERVRESIAKLGYVPSLAAQRMGGSRSYLILALNDRDRTIADWRARQGTDWVDQMLLGGMLTCARHGYRLLLELVDTHSDRIERELAATIAALQPDGVILTPPHSDNPVIASLLDQHDIAFARIGAQGGGAGIALSMADEAGARRATEHLLALGHRRIGFIAGPDDYAVSAQRADGWRGAMREAGLPYDGLLASGDFDYASGREATLRLLGATVPPSAIIASSDKMAIGALAAARERGLDVPADLSLVSFDDTPIARFAHPPLTAMEQPIAAVTARAVELIIAQLSGRARPVAPVVIAGELMVRTSTAPPRV
ncbi:LacI family DNA-binding transcriptional regulator [Sphingomonas sp. BK235]|uniref:LacI family DNA-binding transcriptional regulator n=1 Tax=Sphingomonas sp. BK235 TaxID=2512131 RepID=UPI00104DEC74|nr:LacI family DNA-binding transcriptional regulator [Sphingomonas sp. BK235]TCP32897.1 LacI family transcriptional regulator [Sphingomonas sp. BK235]